MRAVVVSDGKRGHEGQSRALAELMGVPQPPVLTVRRPPPAGEPLLRLLSWFAAPAKWPASLARGVPAQSFGEDALGTLQRSLEERKEEGPLLAISAGTLAAIPALLLAHRLGARTVHLMRPSLVPVRRFDLVVVPQHDVPRSAGSGVLTFPFALGFTGQETLDRCREVLRSRLGLKPGQPMPEGPYLTVLVGGRSAHFSMEPKPLLAFAHALAQLAEERSWRILLSTSRRTPEAVETALKQLQREHREALYFAVWARLDSYNPLPAFFELSQAVVLTEDSVSMISEAVLAGHRPLLLPMRRLRRDGKVARFQRYLLDRKLARRVGEVKELAPLLEDELSRPHRSREEVATELGLNELAATIRSRLGLLL